jgi:hypothetical protein
MLEPAFAAGTLDEDAAIASAAAEKKWPRLFQCGSSALPRRQSMIVPSAWPEVVDFFGTPLVIEPRSGQLFGDAASLPLRQFDQRLNLTQRPSLRRSTTPATPTVTRVLLSRASAQTDWQQNGNNFGRVTPTWPQCRWQRNGDLTVCHTSNLTASPTCFQRHAGGRRAGLKIQWGNSRSGSSPTFGIRYVLRLATCRNSRRGDEPATASPDSDPYRKRGRPVSSAGPSS